MLEPVLELTRLLPNSAVSAPELRRSDGRFPRQCTAQAPRDSWLVWPLWRACYMLLPLDMPLARPTMDGPYGLFLTCRRCCYWQLVGP